MPSSAKLPAFFIGHGSPMNALEDNVFTRSWRAIGENIPAPRAVLCVSAHWLTEGTKVTAMERPQTIHDFGGFPQALFDMRYPAPGSAAIAEEIRAQAPALKIGSNLEWGLDHGTWSVLTHLYPNADVPVLQLSIDIRQPGRHHYEVGRQLAGLRRKGILVVGSGNMVHNLRRIDFSRADLPEFGYDWAHESNALFRRHILSGDHAPLMDYTTLGEAVQLAVPTPDHYYPLLYVLGMQEPEDKVNLFNDVAVMGSITMTSVRIG